MLENPLDLTKDEDSCFIGVGLDENMEGFVSVFIKKDMEESFAKLLFNLVSGKLMHEIMDSVREFCETDGGDIEKIMGILENMIKDIPALVDNRIPSDRLYIKPSQVRNENGFF